MSYNGHRLQISGHRSTTGFCVHSVCHCNNWYLLHTIFCREHPEDVHFYFGICPLLPFCLVHILPVPFHVSTQAQQALFRNVVVRQISVEFNLPIRAIDTIFRPFACNDRLHCFYDAAAGKVNWWFRINLRTDFINLPMIVNTILTGFQVQDRHPMFPIIACSSWRDIDIQ